MAYNIGELDDYSMARHSQLVIFYQAFQRVSQYLGHPTTTDTFLRLYTSAKYGSGVEKLAPACQK